MSEHIAFCDHCFEKIGQQSTAAARLWTELCSLHVKKRGVFHLKASDCEELRIIELVGFITTTESLDHISVKVHGMRVDRTGIYFCCMGCFYD